MIETRDMIRIERFGGNRYEKKRVMKKKKCLMWAVELEEKLNT